MNPTVQEVQAGVGELAAAWKSERAERQIRRHLERADFEALRDAGFLHLVVPEAQGGPWRSVPESTRGICEVLRVLAGADPSVALVSSMHPAVVGFWLAPPDPGRPAWTEQRDAVSASARDGEQWGTITSEPGSGGDITRTKSVAKRDAAAGGGLPGQSYRVTGDKHFGSGSGITSFMITTALPDDDGAPSVFVLDVRDRPWDGSSGLQLIAEWDGAGMAATQSHAMRLEDCPATRMAWDGPVE
jgi:alkylation response protein AidB-like acyl-CoA dehydrogenase